MTHIPTLRLDPAPVPAWTGLRLALCAIAALLAGLLLLGQVGRDEATPAAGFLQQALGSRDADAPLVREPLQGVRTMLDTRSFGFERAGESVSLIPSGARGDWTRYEGGAVRTTPFGSETVLFRGERGLEQFLTVERRQGERTWRWQLQAENLEPRLRVDGAVEFRRGQGTAVLRIAPVAIRDANGQDVTPAGLRWSLAERGSTWWLELELDDAGLPLPYVIDPAIGPAATATAFDTGSPLVLTRPGSAGDLLLAQITVRSTGAITAPAGWNLIGTATGTAIKQSTYWKFATGSEAPAELTWSWPGGHGAGAIVAYANAHPVSPIDASNQGNGSSATASAPTVTTTVPNDRVVAFYGVATGASAVTPTGGQGQTALFTPTGTTSGGPAGSRITIGATEATQATAAVVAAKTATVSNVAWVGNLVAVRQAPDDGDGTLTTAATGSSAGSTGNAITFTYTAGVHGMANGAIAVDAPAGWSAPSTTGSAAGYTISSTGTVGVSGQRLTVTGVTLNAGATMTITYGSTASGGPGATASAATGTVSWAALARGTAAGTLTALGASPSITQYAANGSGTMSVAPTQLIAGNAATLTFTYTAATGGMSNGAVTIAIPSGWTAPNTTVGTAGYTTASTGTVSWNGGTRILTVSGVTRAAATTLTITYGAGAGGAVTVPAGSGTVTWQTQQRSLAAGTLVNLGSSPGSTYNAAPTATVSLAPASPTTNQTVTATATRNDADGDTVTLTYVWKVNGVTRKTTSASSSLTDTLDLSGAGDGDKGQTVSVEVTPNDANQNGTTVSDSEVVANSAPTISTVTIDQGSPTTSQTLTVSVTSADPDGDARTYAYQWRKNGSALAGETGPTLDLSTAGNGSKGDGITVEVVANDGSANSAPALSPAVTVANSAPTISSVTIDQGAPTTNQTLSVTVASADADGDARTYAYQWRKNGSALAGETGPTLDLSTAGNGSKGDGITVEVVANDGSANSAPALSPAVTVANSAPTISSVTIDQGAPTTNQTLSATVVSADADGDARTYAYQWRKNGSDLAGETGPTLDLSTAGNGSKGDGITVEVVADDGSASSAPALSPAVTVANSAPTITSVAIDQLAPKTNDTLTVSVASADADGDSRTYTYQWQLDGSDLPGETAATLDLSSAGNGSKGEDISVEVVANDGSAGSAPATSAPVTIQNSAPTVTSATIDQGSPKTTDAISVTVVSADADGDARTYAYQWQKNGGDRFGETAATFDLAQIGNGDKGDQISVEVVAGDGTASSAPLASAAVTVANSAPVLTSVSIDQVAPATNATLSATITASDPDGDAVTPTRQWRKNGADLTGATGPALDLAVAGNGDKGDAIALRVSVSDGTDTDGPLTSSAVTVANSAPAITSVSIVEASPQTNDTLTVSVASSDLDGDAVAYAYQWRKNGVDLAGETAATLDLSVAGNGSKADTISVRVTGNDGTASSTPSTSTAVTIANTTPSATVTLAPAAPSTTATLTATATKADADGDTVTLTYVWKVDGVTRKTTSGSASLTDTLDLAGAGDGDEGQTVVVEVVPNDGSVDGAATSDSEVVANSAPTATVSLAPAAPKTNQVLTATATKADADSGDTLTLTYVWKVDGVTRKTTSGSASLTDTLDLAGAGDGDKGQIVSVGVTPNDGSVDGSAATDAETVVNSAPTLTSVATDQAAPGTNDTLSVSVSSADADGDARTYGYQWKIDGSDIPGATTATLDLSQAGHGDRGDDVTVEVVANDGSTGSAPLSSAAVTVQNSLPVATVALSPDPAGTNDVLTATATRSDADGDTVTLTYVWKVNGATVKTTAGSSSLTDTLDLAQAGNGSAGDTVTVEATPNDGGAAGTAATDGVGVGNSLPTATVSLAPATPGTNDVVTATATKADTDGDTVTLTYVWKVDGATVKTTPASSSLTDTLDLAQAGNGDEGETITVEVTPNDGSADGTPALDAEIVANTAPSATASLSPAAPTTDDLVTATATRADIDGEPVTLTYVWKVDGATVKTTAGSSSLTDTLDLAQAGNGDKGEAITVEVTPNDGDADGTTASDSALVANSAPVLSSVSIAQAAPKTNDTLSLTVTATDADGDALTPARQWRRNGTDLAGETGATLDLSLAGNGGKGDQLDLRLSVSDGTASSATLTSSSVTVQNSAPTVVSATIDQAAPKTNDTLTVTVATADADGDTATLTYQWAKNGVDRFDETAAGYDLSEIGNGDKGEDVAVRVIASDGTDPSAPVSSAAVTVANSAPVVDTVAIDQAAPKTNDTLTLSVASHDDDGDAVAYAYQWRRNAADVAGATGSTLDLSQAGNGDKGDQLTVRVIGADGGASSSPLTSSAVTIANTAPAATVSLAPATPTTNQILTATATKADSDGDTVSLTYVWKVDGATRKTTAGSSSLTDTLDLSGAGDGDKGQDVTVEVTPHDGDESGTPASGSETVANSAPTIASVTIDQASPATTDVLSVTVASADADGDARFITYQWVKNGADLAGETGATIDLAVVGNGDSGEAISVRVVASDGTASSAPATSSSVTVANSAPTISSVTIDQAAPRTNDVLSASVVSADADGDARSHAYQWRLGGVDIAGATAATLDLSQAGNGDKGDAISVRVTASDGTDPSAPATSAAVTILNSAPTVGSLTIDQAAPKTNDTLTFTLAASDADGDTLTQTRQWLEGGADLAGATAAALDLSQPGNGDKGDTIAVRVSVSDGSAMSGPSTSAGVVVLNTAPTVDSVSIDQAAPGTDEVLTVTVASADADGDARTLAYQWRKNGLDLAGETGATLDLALAGNGDKADAISVEVVANDGSASSTPRLSGEVAVANSAPTISSVTIDQAAPRTNDVLSATVVSADADGDARTHAYQWQRNGIDLVGQTGATLDLSGAGNGDKADDIALKVTAGDGSVSSSPATSAAISIQNSAPTITLAAIDQGSAQTNDTIDSTVTAADADGDAVTVTRQWTKNAVDVAGATGVNLDLSVAGNGDKGDLLRIRGEATDGDEDAAPITSAPLTVSNSVPTAGVTLAPASPATDDVVTATATRADVDADAVTLTYVWKVEGVTVKTTPGSSALTDTLDLALPSNGNGGDTVSVEVTPHDGTASGSPQSDSVGVGFRPDHLAFTSSTTDLPSGTQRTLSVEVRDPDGALVAGDNSTLVTFAKTSGSGTATGLGTAAVAAGVASLDVSGALAGALTVTATAAGLGGDGSTFTVIHGAATRINLNASGSNGSGATKTLTATIQDAAGNTVTADSSTVVTLAKTGGSGSVTGLGTDTASNGVASLDVTNTLAGQIDVEASAAGLAAGAAIWTIGAGSASLATSTIDATPGTIVADGATTSTITVQLKDAAGNDLAAGGGVVALSLSGTGSLGGVTDEGDGTYTATLTSPTTVGSGSITGTLNAVALADSAAVTYVHGPADAIVLTDSGSLVAGNAHTLTATIVDAHGNTMTSDSSTVVTFAKASGAGTVTGLGTAVASSGIATKAVTNALAGPISAEATAAGLATGTAGYTIVAGPVNAATSTVVASPTSVQNDGADTSTITVTVRDAGGNLLAGETVTLDDDGADSAIAPSSTTTNGSGVATFGVTSTTVESAVYTATAGGIELTDTASVSFVFNDTNDPTNTIALAGATGAFLTGTELFYRPAAAGSFTLSSTVADSGSGPASATYPAVGETGWAHALEIVSMPAAGPYVSSPFSWTAAAAGDFSIVVTAADGWTPANTNDTTIDVIEDSSAPTGQTISLGGGPVFAALSVPFVLGDGADLGAGLDTATRTVTRESALLVDGTCGTFTSDIGVFASPDTSVQSGRCYRYSFTLSDRVGNASAAVTSTVAQIDTAAPPAPVQTVTETGDDAHATGSTLYYDPAGSGSFTVTSAASDGESGIDKVGFAAPASGFASGDPADDSTPPYARSYSWAAGATGSGAQAVTALDHAGHSSAGSFTLTPDAADPAVSFDAPAGGAMLDSGSHALEATASDAGAGVASVLFEVSSTGAGGPFSAIGAVDTTAPYAASWDTTAVADGPKVLRATVTDNVGHTATATRNVAVDKVPGAPVTSITSQPADPSANTTPTFGFGSSETPSTFECRIDGGGWSACPSPHAVSPALGDGSHTLEVRASDAAANQDATPESYTWVVDATAPTGALTAPAALAAVSGNAVVVTSASADSGSGVQHALFEVLVGGSWQALGAPDTAAPYSVTWDTTGLADGDHDLRVTTRDNAGNSGVSAVRTVTVDNSLPLLSASVSHNPVNLTTPDPAQVSAVADDLGSGIANVLFEQCNETSAACTSDTWTMLVGPDTVAPYEVDWAIPSDGQRLLRVTATDNAGRSAVELILTTVDRTRPSGAVTAPASGADLRVSVALAATASDPAPGSVNTVTFQVSPAGAGVWDDLGTDGSAPYGATLDTTGLTDGLYDLRVFTTDAAGNAETTPATTSVRVDNTAPTTTDDAPAGWRDGDVAVALTAGDPGGSGVAQTEYRLDGAAAQPYTGPVTVSGEGVHELEYRSQDAAGNWESWQTTSVRIDETDPVTTDDAPVAWQAGATTVTLSPSDAGGSGLATTTFELDGGATQTGATVNVPATHGVHAITYRSTDAAGNVETDRSASVRIDRQAPATSDDAPAGSAGNLPVTVTLTAVDADSGVGTTTYEVNGGATQSGTSVSIPAVTGTYTITYRSTDAVGNGEATRTATVQIDATAPTTSATISPRNPNNGPITVSLSAVDAGGAGVDETRFRIDGGAQTAGSSALVAGADGPHTVHFYSVDTLGNVEAEQLVTVTIDTAGPTGTPSNPTGYLRGTAAELRWTPDTPADVSSVTFEFSAAGAGAWAALPGGTIATPMLADYIYSWNTTAVADGPYDLRVRVEDELGNETIQLLPGLPKTVDNGLPTATVSTPAGGSFVSGSVALGGSASDALSGISSTAIQLKPDGAAGFTTVASSSTGAVSTTWDSSSAADGPVEIKVVATDGAGNQAESAVVSFTVDNDAPTVTLADPGVAVSASPTLTATAAVDTASVAFESREAGSTPWLPIGTDATPGDGFSATWSTGPLAEGTYELRARATDGGGNTGTSGLRTVVLDKTNPTGSVTAPTGSSTIGGIAVALAADAAGTGSDVRDVVFLVKQFGSSTFDPVGTDATAPYALTWDASGATDGAAELRVLVTDVAGNTHTSAVVPVTLDSSGPSVTLTDPGSVLSGAVALAVTTGGGAVRVGFEISPAGAGSWTEIATDTTVPFGAALDTAAHADGVYDLRATGFDSLDNPSTPSVRAGVRFDNTAPSLLSATPADGSVSTSASQMVLEASEPVTVNGALLDGGAAPAPAISGTTITFATGSLADGVHVLAGWLEDASGTQTPFRVAVTIENAPGADRLPVEKSMSYTTTLVTAAGGLATVSLPPAGWPTAPSADDFLVVRVDPSPPTPSVAPGIVPGGHVIEVTAHWALAGTPVTAFAAPLDITIPNPGGAFVAPSTSDDGTTWRSLARLDGSTLPAGQLDGYYVDGANVHVLTRHLSFFALMLDDEAPTPPTHLAGVVADDGLTIRWLPGTDSSGHLGNVILVVNGGEYRHFGPTEYEAKLGAIEPDDTRRFQLLQLDGAGNKSILTPVLRAVPTVAGLGVDAARAALAERGFRLGAVREEIVPTVAAGTVVAPAALTMAVESSAIDLVVARGAAAAQTKFVLQVASAPTVTLQKRTTFAARVKVTRPARLIATLYSPAKKRVFTWRRNVKAGSSIVKLRLPARIRRPGTYRVVWVARSGAETIRRTVNVRLVAPRTVKLRPRQQKVDVVFAGERPALDKIAARLRGTRARVVARTDDDGTFALASSRSRNIGVAVVDVDDYGVGLVRELGIVFPRLRLIGIARDPGTRKRAVRAGAVLALPRSTPAAKAARAIARIAGR